MLLVQFYQLLGHVRQIGLRQDVQQLAQVTSSADEPNTPRRQHEDAASKEANENSHLNRLKIAYTTIYDTFASRVQPE
jgi:hypothetical protein